MDITIVGFGIAGALSAYQLHKAGFNVRIIVSTTEPRSTNVAGGMITPITGQRCTPSWRIQELLPLAIQTYSEFSEDGKGLWRTILQRRILQNETVANYFHERLRNGEYDGISVTHNNTTEIDGILSPYGFYDMQQCVIVNMLGVVQYLREYLLSQGVEFIDSTVKVNNELLFNTYEQYLWCIGNSTSNELWNWLPLLPSKGETLTVRIENWNADYVVNAGIWIAPLGSGLYKIGSTNVWDDFTLETTQQAREHLLSAATKLLGCTIHVVSQNAGIRPATQHRLPFVGPHPKYPQHCIFTGLGAKGASFAPFVAQCLVDYYTNGKPLHKEFDCSQHYKAPL